MKFKDIFLLPNLVTITRLIVTIYLFLNFTPDFFTITNLILIIAIIGISDAVDGIVARKLNQVSKLGTILDPFTDRIVFVMLLFWLIDYFPIWFIYFLIIREIFTLIGALYILIKNKIVTVSNKGKLGTTLIFISICLTVLNTTLNLIIIDYFTYISLIFYYYVALEYLYKLIYKNE